MGLIEDWIDKIHQGDCMEVLSRMPEESVHMCVSSPPYWAARDYGVEGQIGLEKSVYDYIDAMKSIFREVRRVLRSDGTLWLNIGDVYVGTGDKGDRKDPKYREGRNAQSVALNRKVEGLKPKDMCGIPWRVAFALQHDGWWLRSDNIWHKTNAFPSPVTDRTTTAHEYVFMFSKSQHYFYDADAVREDSLQGVDTGRNKRTVWSIPSEPSRDEHYAAFPQKLVETPILAGTSEKGCCVECGSQVKRVVEVSGGAIGESWNDHKDDLKKGQRSASTSSGYLNDYSRRTTGWSRTCKCSSEETDGCVILDPFMGSGTTALVALKAKRRFVGIELNPKYVKLAEKRIEAELLQQKLF